MPSSYDFLERCDKLAVFGGTFDPIHNAHLAVADAVMQNFSPKRLLFIPAGEPPHKQGTKTKPNHRYEMILSSICKYPAYDVSKMEIDRPGTSYTVDTIIELREVCPPNAEILLCIGSDAFLEMLSWKNVQELFSLCELIVATRPGAVYDEKLNFKKTFFG